MIETHQPTDEQAALWNGRAGRAWVDAQALLDQLFEPFAERLVEAASSRPVARVLDVGCGTGGTTLAIARRLGAASDCIGVDISEPMISAAQSRAERDGTSARFVCADAQTYPFESARFDLITSRFGVMFFADPTAAFANLRRASRDGARLRMFAWRSASENPFMTTAERAAAPVLPNLPVRRAEGPGQFAFADAGHVGGILSQSGWDDIEIERCDVACTMPEPELVRYLTRLGPLGLVLEQLEPPLRSQVIEAVRAAFEPFVHGTEVRFEAACWDIGARAASERAR